MSFTDELLADALAVEDSIEPGFVAFGEAVLDSIVNGSSVTGAQGLPVRTGKLRGSYTLQVRGKGKLAIVSDDPKALFVEEDARHIHFHNGGPHGEKLTVNAAQQLLNTVIPAAVVV